MNKFLKLLVCALLIVLFAQAFALAAVLEEEYTTDSADYETIQSIDVVFTDGYVVHMTFDASVIGRHTIESLYNDAIMCKAEGNDNMNIYGAVYAEDD